MKTIRVVAAVICDGFAAPTKILSTQKGYGKLKGKWEFPGGKIEAGETAQEALEREIREELAVEIVIGEKITTIEYDYPEFHLSMDCFWCMLKDSEFRLLEATDARWLTVETLHRVDWLPADLGLIDELERIMTG